MTRSVSGARKVKRTRAEGFFAASRVARLCCFQPGVGGVEVLREWMASRAIVLRVASCLARGSAALRAGEVVRVDWMAGAAVRQVL